MSWSPTQKDQRRSCKHRQAKKRRSSGREETNKDGISENTVAGGHRSSKASAVKKQGIGAATSTKERGIWAATSEERETDGDLGRIEKAESSGTKLNPK